MIMCEAKVLDLDIDGSLGKIDEGTDFLNTTTSTGASGGAGGLIVGGSASASIFKNVVDASVDERFGSISVGGEAGIGLGGITLGYSLNADA